MIKKLSTVTLALLLGAGSLYAGKGKIRVTSDMQGAYVYVDGKKKAMTGEGFTSILLEEGEHTIKVLKQKDKYMGYVAEKRVFVGEDTSMKISFKLQLQATTLKTIWDKIFGGKKDDWANSIIQVKDGGYVVVGMTESKGAGGRDVWLLKLDRDGNKLWDKTFGAKKDDGANSIIQASDGGYVVSGWIYSKGAWSLKLDRDENKLWDKTFGDNYASSIIQEKDGGYVVAGHTWSKGAGGRDVWLLKLDRDGNKLWDKTFGGKKDDSTNSIIQAKDGGYVVAGVTESKGAGKKDALILKLDKDGNKLWDKTFGGKNWDEAMSIIQIKDGGYVVAGHTWSKGAGGEDVWLLKLDKDGNKLWDKTFGGKDGDGADFIIQAKDGGYVVAGHTWSKGAGGEDVWLLKLDEDGNKLWDKTFGGKDWDEAKSIIQIKDGGYVVAGWTESKGAGGKDVWILKIKEIE